MAVSFKLSYTCHIGLILNRKLLWTKYFKYLLTIKKTPNVLTNITRANWGAYDSTFQIIYKF